MARLDDWEDPKLAAKLFLSAFWDQVGVVGVDGQTPAMALAFPWNLGDTVRVDGPAYAVAATENPWSGDPRSIVLRMRVSPPSARLSAGVGSGGLRIASAKAR